MNIDQALLSVHAFATLFMTGLIWTVQVVHYPLFARVGQGAHESYEREHMRRIAWLVGPGMVTEAGAAAWLIMSTPPGVPMWSVAAGTGLLAVIWISTAVLQAPMHASLARAFDTRVHAALVGTNWIRTIAWSARAVLALWMLVQVTPG